MLRSAEGGGSTDFRILGSLEIRDGDRLLALGGPRQRALLAVLLLHANEVISADRLIDALWSGRPPATAAKGLQMRVSQLRKLLGPSDVLETRSPGYLLRLAPDELDSDRFARLSEEGRRLLRTGDVPEAARTLRSALGVWRGPALADVAYEEFAQAPIARLEELRLVTLEHRIEADLLLGRHDELVAELEAITRLHPLRERPRAQLMLALYRSGRQAEALETYQSARHVLVEELGIEPGPALAELEKAILTQDPALDAPTPVELPTVVSSPAPGPGPSEERKVVTILWAELAGPGAEAEDPERARLLLERLYDAIAIEIEALGGVAERFVGAALLAVFGVPSVREDDAERALHAALALRRRLAKLYGEDVEIRIGVETGAVVAGRAGGGDPLVTGSAVNAAARLARSAASGEIVVGERTTEAVGAAFELEQRPETGRRLAGAVAFSRPRGVAGLPRAFVGRENELGALLAAHQKAVAEGEPHLVTVVGDPGIGKSRLAQELGERLDGDFPGRLRSGRCLPYGQAITYAPLAEILREELGLGENDAPEVVRSRLGDRPILGLTLGIDVAGDLHPLEARERLHEAWVATLEELVADEPAIVLVEDLHWAEEPLLELLERILSELRGPLLLVATTRAELLERRPTWSAGRRRATTLWLEPLSPTDTKRLLDELLGGEPAAMLSELVVERADGNPFVVEELVATLVDSGVLELTEGRWSARALPERFDAPQSVQAVIAARIDLLPAGAKAALQSASVIGRVFWSEPVRELLGGSEPDLDVLAQRDFVRRRATSSLAGRQELEIKHALTREVAYSTLPKARRARLHAVFADWLERAGHGRDEHAHLLAIHYADAVRPDDADVAWAGAEEELPALRAKAVTWLRRASELATGRYAIHEAKTLLERALELTDDKPTRAELWRALGRAAKMEYDGETFWLALEQAIELSPDGARADLYAELALETASRPGMWLRSPERGRIENWIARALDLGARGSRVEAQALAARALVDPAGGADDALAVSALADRLDDDELRWYAWRARLNALVETERYEEALATVEEGGRRLVELSDPDHRDTAPFYGALGALGAARLDEARRYGDLLDEIRFTPHHAVHGVGVRLMVEELAGDWPAVRGLRAEAEARVTANLETPCAFNVRSLLVCALAEVLGGDDAEARLLEERADALGMEGYGLTHDAVRVRLALVRRDLEAVERLLAGPAERMIFTRVASLAARLDGLAALRDRERLEQEAPPLLLPGTYLEPFALRALGIVRADDGLVARAAARFEALGLDWHAARTREQF